MKIKAFTMAEVLITLGKCTFKEDADAASYLGFGCTAYAIMDINPDTKKSGYWNEFLK